MQKIIVYSVPIPCQPPSSYLKSLSLYQTQVIIDNIKVLLEEMNPDKGEFSIINSRMDKLEFHRSQDLLTYKIDMHCNSIITQK